MAHSTRRKNAKDEEWKLRRRKKGKIVITYYYTKHNGNDGNWKIMEIKNMEKKEVEGRRLVKKVCNGFEIKSEDSINSSHEAEAK